MIFSGFEVGSAVVYLYASIARDFSYAQAHPVTEAYNIFLPKHEGRPAWDPTAVLEAIRPDRGYFDLSVAGRVQLGPRNVTIFRSEPTGNARFLQVNREQATRVRELIAALVSEPPQRNSNIPAGSQHVIF